MKKNKANLLFVVIVLISVALMLYSLQTTTQKQIQLVEEKILQEAIAHFDNMIFTRSWNAIYGGVYVKPIEGLKPNPYLPHNTLQTADGENLIKINPAWMTRQISELSNKKSHYYYKITSLKPINPHNAPDAFETEALKYFEQHQDKKYYYDLSSDKKTFNFMGALKTEPACLPCHRYQNYKVGDIRGGIRVSVPTELLQQEIHAIRTQSDNNVIFIVILASGVLLIFFQFVATMYQHQQKIEFLNQSLEKKVINRTRRLEKMYSYEKYIKDLLKTVANINELLLNSLSIQSVLKNSSDELAKHQNYCFTWIGLVKDNLLEVAHKSNNHSEIIDCNVYSFDHHPAADTSSAAAIEAINRNQTIIKSYQPPLVKKRLSEHSKVHWQIAIPLITNDCNSPFGVLNVYSNRISGFEPEEVNVLEGLATDMSLILHSRKQKSILEQMELQRVSNYEETILAFVNIIEQRDTYTAGHTLRVAEYCKKIATALNIEPEQIIKLERAAILHDIGKVATPDAVLLKPGKLTSLEYDLIKQHAYAGFIMLSKIDMYKDLAEIIRYHHVKYDGKGYPSTHAPDEVPFLSHIMAVADAFDAMTTNRIYKPKQTVSQALQELAHYSGSQFHPQVAQAAIKVLQNVEVVNTNQSPTTEQEQKRFSYFFEDSLTSLYNESYLQIILSNIDRKHHCFYLILLGNFSQYNKKQGWDQGNILLIELAKTLKERFPKALGFRYHGDDFVLLFEQHVEINKKELEKLPLLVNNEISLTVKHLELDNIDYDSRSIYEKISKIR